MARTPAPAAAATFQRLSRPVRSSTSRPWSSAVVTSHGSSPAFSTGSQPQNPPQPSSTYAQWAPARSPPARISHVTPAMRRAPVGLHPPTASANSAMHPTRPQ